MLKDPDESVQDWGGKLQTYMKVYGYCKEFQLSQIPLIPQGLYDVIIHSFTVNRVVLEDPHAHAVLIRELKSFIANEGLNVNAIVAIYLDMVWCGNNQEDKAVMDLNKMRVRDLPCTLAKKAVYFAEIVTLNTLKPLVGQGQAKAAQCKNFCSHLLHILDEKDIVSMDDIVSQKHSEVTTVLRCLKGLVSRSILNAQETYDDVDEVLRLIGSADGSPQALIANALDSSEYYREDL
jgi:ribosome biogenesis protein Tsr3